ncbi:hypothetical protein [Nocardioides terrisoli]|uniref:hypothetical protein n=1 Tax=Nocardioides terrisoli TaxID=3388267 RepID=UPI00287BC156|nr:hypothetical protein [Nocardioides marmorisolisilvae]
MWERWVSAEPELAPYDGLAEVHSLRGADADGPLGALVRLAAYDGGDDELAAYAVVHQLEAGARCLMHGLADTCQDSDATVLSCLWIRIRTFPWQRRRRAYAANILRDTRAQAVKLLCPQRSIRELHFRDQDGWDEFVRPVLSTPGVADAAIELADLLGWARRSRVIGRAEMEFLVELLAAAESFEDQQRPAMRKGVCPQAVTRQLAERRGVCPKTISRERDRILARLRDAVPRYLHEAA